ncbi:class I SAM-dependent methyltransferase [Methylocapsa sp. D3K7]|uniref:class I SAM-dependent methyltransferase n=1 Tax=Methylocapsa sp. D3K7 TaxID=3041435 RepID=UPI00244ED200|nr:class I SAM-dependent methyltransferase [Methylocapsa sp. D3K7]WGJ15140.1 class I SAM-dependent methyltransferase [Methylocapsa sp. D3K7]
MQNNLHEALAKAANRYPIELVVEQVNDIPRIFYHVGLALKGIEPKPPGELEICDLGGGVGLFSIGCAALGFRRTVLVDDFNDFINSNVGGGQSILDLHRDSGVEVVSRDVIAKGISDLEGYFDIITSFDSMEHWHNSPKQLFAEVVAKLKPGGVFILGVPNSVNLRKRISVPLGKGNWSSMEHWYEQPQFRGHVREPVVEDLIYISNDMKLHDVEIFGRNWLGYYSRNPAVRALTKLMDYPLRLRPSLCSDLYMIGKKPN